MNDIPYFKVISGWKDVLIGYSKIHTVYIKILISLILKDQPDNGLIGQLGE